MDPDMPLLFQVHFMNFRLMNFTIVTNFTYLQRMMKYSSKQTSMRTPRKGKKKT